MTFHSGMRRRKVPVLPSTPQGQTRATDGAPGVFLGGTGARTVPEARENLDVPGLSANNALTGDNTMSGDTTFSGDATFQANALIGASGTLKWGDAVGGNSLVGSATTDVRSWDLPDSSGVLNTFALYVKYVAKTANYTLTYADCVVDVTSGSPTITLPTAVGANADTGQKVFIIKNSGAGTVTLATTSGQTIDGAAPGTLAAGSALTVVSTGANWIIV